MAWLEIPEDVEQVLASMRGKDAGAHPGVIKDVRIKTLKKWVDVRGYFIEQLKRGDVDDQGNEMIPGDQQFSQLSRSLAYSRGGNPPELIKAFHWHKKQWDYWDIIQGNVRIVLVDLRATSPTVGTVQVIAAGEHASKMIAIPPFVAHGYQCLDRQDVILNYYVTEPYDPHDPDEGRIPWNDERIGFDWRIANI